jgi:hypothetical protein
MTKDQEKREATTLLIAEKVNLEQHDNDQRQHTQ